MPIGVVIGVVTPSSPVGNAAETAISYLISTPVPGWRNGRRGGLKILCPQGRVGSNPTLGTSALHVQPGDRSVRGPVLWRFILPSQEIEAYGSGWWMMPLFDEAASLAGQID